MNLPEIDWTRIQVIIDQTSQLERSGAMDRETWLRLNHEFADISRGILPMPGVLGRAAKSSEWFDALRNESSKRVA
jgi:hypothetical protein